MTCKHQQIRTWVYEDTKEPCGLWSCVDCGLKFEPITQRTWVNSYLDSTPQRTADLTTIHTCTPPQEKNSG